MVESKAYLLSLFLFAFLLSPHLGHELPEFSPENLRSYNNYEGDAILNNDDVADSKSSTSGMRLQYYVANDEDSLPLATVLSTTNDNSHIPSTIFQEDAGKTTQDDEDPRVREPNHYSTFPKASRKITLGTKGKSIQVGDEDPRDREPNYNSAFAKTSPKINLGTEGKSTHHGGDHGDTPNYYSTFPKAVAANEPNNYEDANEQRQHNMVRLSTNDWRALFHQALDAKLDEMEHGGRTIYSNVPRN